jgi:hypothetical protein
LASTKDDVLEKLDWWPRAGGRLNEAWFMCELNEPAAPDWREEGGGGGMLDA